MTMRMHNTRRTLRGVGLVEIMVGIIIGMLMVLVIFQVYEVSESQKRTITAGSDAQQNASFGLYVLARDLSMAGNGIASAATVLDGCAMLRPIPVLIDAGASDNVPDTITALYGASSSLSTPTSFKQSATTASPYVVAGPVAFSPNDVILAVQGGNCTLSTIDAGGVAVDPLTGFATLTQTWVSGANGVTYGAVNASLLNLGPAAAMGRIVYTVDTTTQALRTQKQLPTADPVNPLVSDVVNLKAQYGLDTDNDGIVDTWQAATGDWSAANVAGKPIATLQQIRAVRIAIVTRSAQYERDPITAGSPPGMPAGTLGMFCDPAPACAFKMTLSADDQHYRYKILENVVPLRNALWNAP